MDEIKCPNCQCSLKLVMVDKNEDEMSSEEMDKAMDREHKSKNKLEEYD